MEEDKTTNPHDHLTRLVFSRPEEAAGFFREYLPKDIAELVSAERLHLEPTNFVDEALRGSVADLLYRLEIPDGEDTFLYCLFEHQSQPDHWMHLRLLRYMLRIWDGYLAQYPKSHSLPLVIPILLHQGKQGWTAATSFRELFNIPGSLQESTRAFLPDFSFNLVDLKGLPFQEIRGTLLGCLALQALKAVSENRIEEFINTSAGLLRNLFDAENPMDVVMALLRYFYVTDHSIDKEGFNHMVKRIGTPLAKDTAMTIAEEYIEEGMQQGMQKGMQQGQKEIVLRMNASGMDVEQIVSLTGIAKANVLQYLASGE